ncbi:juvenile hormone esterase-like [Ostrinia nubilalis]|uniref:juvenile hormone esterase-like n=1 Tax=Ostrinia nubilalis TaxID=29057 RepID=UPI00308238C2
MGRLFTKMYGLPHVIGVLFCAIYFVNGDVIVETKSGKVAGVEVQSILPNEKFFSFFSIPYAEPPKRFMPPKPHPGWSDILSAKKEKKPCAHYYLPMKHVKNYGFSGSEDCLHLSVHTPKLPNTDNPNLPVIVFLYNENFNTAYNASKQYGPDFFMKEGVIIVTLQHRLGSLGFLSFEDDLLPGNNGLRDVIMALKWVQANIRSFGGDPNRVTLMGHNGGSVIVDIFLQSPKTKGLFSRAILHSGTSWDPTFIRDKGARERAIKFSKELDEHATTSSYLLKRLTDFDVMVLTELEGRAVHADEARIIQQGVIPFHPVVEHDHPDAVITKLPESKPIEIDVPIMIGYNSREGIAHSERYLQMPQFLTMADRDFVFLFPYRTNYSFDLLSQVYNEAIQSIKDFYFKEGYIQISYPGEYISYSGDLFQFYGIDYTVRQYTNNTNTPVYYFMFDYSGEFNLKKKMFMEGATSIDGTWGANLGDDLCYLFVCKPIRKAYKKALKEEDSEEMTVLNNMVKMWSNFAKEGNPTPPGSDVEWKPATTDKKECMVISDELTLKTNLHDNVVTFWDNFIEKYKNMAVNGIVKDNKKDEL